MSEVNESRPRGLKGDIHLARNGAKATAAELREFVREFRGRSPQEMLGLVAGSNLVQATILATVITVIFMAAFTVGPYFYKKANPVAAKPAKAPAAAAPAPAPTASATAAAPVAATTAATAAAPLPVATGTGPATPDVLNTLGIGETKVSDPKKNPLEAGGDDLLKDLK
jgi:predicted flap endonuclease-1-like 5' DNA nuclease